MKGWITISKKYVIRTISVFSFIILVLLGLLYKTQQSNNKYKLQLENALSHNLDEFNSSVNNISVTLNKLRFVTSPEQLSDMSAQLLTEAEISKMSLSQLPSNSQLKTINKFLSQVGSYAQSISKKVISGRKIEESDQKNLNSLSTHARDISKIISDTHITYNNPEYWAKELEKKVDEKLEENNLSDSLQKLEEELVDIPTLIYDGPYSDHILEKEPEMLKNVADVSEKNAKDTALLYADMQNKELKYDGFVSGKIPSYRFIGNNTYIEVSKAGGYTVFMRKTRKITESALSYEQAVEKAKRYLERLNLTSFVSTYYYTNEGVCVINFAYQDGKTICYTDLIKVGVAMDNGEIMLYEAAGYITNHKERAFEAPKYSEEHARNKVSKSLNIKKTALVLIPTNSQTEIRCYEFSCISEDGQEILVYINLLTLKEEEVLILLKQDGGTLVK